MTNTISVSGSGTASTAPDLAILELGVDVLAKSIGEARATASREMNAVIEALRTGGLQDADLTTTAYDIHPEYDHREGRRLRGYRITNMVEARINEPDALGEIVDAASEAGSTHVVVRGLRFVHSDESELAAVARRAAWNDAKSRADQLAALAGVAVGAVQSISEHRSHSGGPPALRARAMESAAAPPIESGQLAVSISVDIEFAIKDRAP